jgi:ATP-binding cassette subfamily F protein 3
LDMDARAALIQALNGYDGCVILVSHDPHLVEAVADQLWLVKDGAVTDFNGTLEEYRELIIEQRKKERSGAKKEKNKENKNEKGGKNKSKNKKNYALDKAEQNLSRWSKEVQELENEMASDKAMMHSGFMNDLLDRYKIAQKEFEASEVTWLEALEKESSEA